MSSLRRRPAARASASVTRESRTSAATKKAAAAFENQASVASVPATSPQAGRRAARAYAAHAPTMKAVIVDSIRAARFHITKT